MDNITDLRFERASLEDADELIELRNRCFYADYIKYGECPGYNQTREDMTRAIINRIVYKVISGNQIIGNISIMDNLDHTYYICCLCVAPGFENRGIGHKIISFAESSFPDAVAWSLETPADNEKNVYFYKKAGYSIIGECIKGPVKLVLLEKKISN